ncbi:hypothetical protein [Listeria farberi]|uniref:DUF5067 domain-containing protein n=1 Tax=Listeria farberi TaxID=2713500 RepID=A0A7X1DFN1_9LIST|nr:hypothetical protein [Listeria farberi]MBC2288561.1 hypothetical protein [Listeria farberi]
MKKGILILMVLSFSLLLVACGSTEKTSSDEKKTVEKKESNNKKKSKNDTLKISDAKVITQVQYYVKKYDKKNNIKWESNKEDYNIAKMPVLQATDDGKIYDNVYSAFGTYSVDNKEYDYTIQINFPSEDTSQLIVLDTDMGTKFEIPCEVKK